MKKDIQTLINKINNKNKTKKIWKSVIAILSCIVVIATIYALVVPARTETGDGKYTFHLIDSYDFEWKKQDKYTTSYDIAISFVDTTGNPLNGKDLTLNLSPDNYLDDPYAFGYVPLYSGSARGKNLIDEFNLYEVTSANGDYYVFDHLEVYTGGAWHTFSEEGNHWHIWCQNSSSTEEPENQNYSWRGQYDTNTMYHIDNNTEYKLVYKFYRYGDYKNVISLGADSGIKFEIFNYTGENTQTGINDNGVYDYFTFRNSSKDENYQINSTVDADGFGDNRAYVEPKLVNNYPVFDCKTKGACTNNFSLGYLFGEQTNPAGAATKGVTSYNPTNTLLQNETIEGVKYYYYDSKRNAVDYDIYSNTFNVRNYLERSYTLSGQKNESLRYDFLPFTYLNTTTTKTHPTTGFSYNYEQEEIDHWYGMTMEFEFHMPANGEINAKDMIFSFSGDDDVWVFIDDVLVLDLGGTHGSVDGSINFATGAVEGYLNWNGTVGTKEKGTKDETTIYDMFTNANAIDEVRWNNSNTTFANYTKHTLKFFYLERGAAVANCKINFNIPVLPPGILSVKKQFEGTENYNENFGFTLYDKTSGTATPVANTKYTIGNTEYTTDANGNFALKVGEEAIFKLTNEHTYYVKETNPGEHATSFKCSFDGNDCPSITQTPDFTMDPESSYQAIFTNTIKKYDLNVSKDVYGESDETFEFQLNLSKSGTSIDIPDDINSKYIVDHTNGIVTFNLKDGESITIKDITVDTNIILKETKHDGYNTIIKTGEKTLAESDTYEFVLTTNSEKNITVHNIPGVMLPETGGNGMIYYIIIGVNMIMLSLLGYKYYSKTKLGVK